MSHKSASRRLKISGLIVFILCFIVIAALAAFSWKVWQDRANGEIPHLFGYEMVAENDSSMEPQISKGSGVFLVSCTDSQREQFGIQDVLVVPAEETSSYLVKRVIEVQTIEEEDQLQYCLKGDGDKAAMWVLPDEVIGEAVYSVPYLGNLLNLLETFQGLLLVILIPCGFCLIVELILLISAAVVGKKEKEKVQGQGGLPNDRDEHFVDVTAQYMNRSAPKLQRFLAEEKQEAQAEREKFAQLDYNPLMERPAPALARQEMPRQPEKAPQPEKEKEPLERITLNTREAVAPVPQKENKKLTMLVDGAEAAEFPLTSGQCFKLKIQDCIVEIAIRPNKE